MFTFSVVTAVQTLVDDGGFAKDREVCCVINQRGHIYGLWAGVNREKEATDYAGRLKPTTQPPSLCGGANYVRDGRVY